MIPAEKSHEERRRDSVTRGDINNIVDKITGVENAFVECQKRIAKAVEERIGEHSAIRQLRDSIGELKKDIVRAVSNGDERLKSHDVEIEECVKRIEALELNVKQILDRLYQVELLSRLTKVAAEDAKLAAEDSKRSSSLALESTEDVKRSADDARKELRSDIKSVGDNVNSLHETFNHFIAMSAGGKGRRFSSSKIPAIAWPVIGVVSIALIAAFTGHMAEFIDWLETIKIFGV